MFTQNSKKGFFLGSVAVTLFVIGLSTVLIMGLIEQSARVAKKAQITSSIMEMRTKVNSISENPALWIQKMRGNTISSVGIAKCIPDDQSIPTTAECPVLSQAEIDKDEKLAQMSMGENVSPVSLVDLMGEQISGTDNTPLRLDEQGRPCNDDTKCVLKSTSYLIWNPAASVANRNYRIVIKLQKNQVQMASPVATIGPIQSRYFSIDVGSLTDKTGSNSLCPKDTIKLGYLPSGEPYCVSTVKQCASGEIVVGVKDDGSVECAIPPTCAQNFSGVLDPKTKQLTCTLSSPCAKDEIYVGVDAANGKAICVAHQKSCATGEIQVGAEQGSCLAIPKCEEMSITYDGEKLACVKNQSTDRNCEGKVVEGIKADGTLMCKDLPSGTPPNPVIANCSPGSYVSIIKPDGTAVCTPLPEAPPVDGARPLYVSQIKINQNVVSTVNSGIYQSGISIEGYNGPFTQSLWASCALTGNPTTDKEKMGRFWSDLSFCMIHMCNGLNRKYPVMAQATGACVSGQYGGVCNGIYQMGASCMY